MVCNPILSAVDRRKGKTGEWDIRIMAVSRLAMLANSELSGM